MNKTYISEVIDQLGVSKYTYTMYILVGIALLFDGFDYMIVAYTMPQMAAEWGLTKVQTGSLTSWSLIGLIIGGLTAGIISDRIGRKKTLSIFVAMYSLLTLPIYFVHSFEVFAMLRILSGIGLGACIPIAVTMMTESAPTYKRGFFTSSIMAFYILGWVVAGIVAITIVPVFGWRVCYLIGGIPAFYALILWFKMRESPYWLLSKGREKEAIEVVKTIEIAARGKAGEWPPGRLIIPPVLPKVGVSMIFSPNYRKATLANWTIYFMGSVLIYGISGWLPTLLVESGFGVVRGYSFAVLQNIFAIIGSMTIGFFADIIGRRLNVSLSWFFTAVFAILLGFATTQWQVILFIIIVGFLMNGALSSTQPLLTESYPTEFRSTGVAWAQAFGRLGGFSGPIAAGFIQQLGAGFTGLFIFFAIPSFIAAAVAFFFVAETKDKAIEKIVSANV